MSQTDTATDAGTDVTVQHRNQYVFLFDAQDCNPNGNPQTPAGDPRIDPDTRQCIATDVRFKRYIRDQLHAEDYPVYLKNVRRPSGASPTREFLAELTMEEAGIQNADALEEIENALNTFLDNAIDVRMFGATFSFSLEEDSERLAAALDDEFPAHFPGAVQFSPARSLHPVTLNETSDSLTSILASESAQDEREKESGGYGLDDKRVQYAMMRYSGIVDQRRAETTLLTEADLRTLDRTIWTAYRDQTITRSKVGQEPLFLARIEYIDGGTHLGRLGDTLDVVTDDPEAMRTTKDAPVDLGAFLDTLDHVSDRIRTVYLRANPVLRAVDTRTETEADGVGDIYEWFEEAVGEDGVQLLPHERR